MKHLFVSYELALKLKEKGFDEPCFMFYYNDGDGLTDDGIFKTGTDSNPCNAPLYQQVTDWFRINYGFYVNAEYNEFIHLYHGTIADVRNRKCYIIDGIGESKDYYETFNKVIEEALKLI